MPVHDMRSIRNRAFSLVRAFESHGVTPTLSGRSWSGLRDDDRTVVFAIRASEVHFDPQGCSRVLLWAAANARAAAWLDAESAMERLAHCRLAMTHGGAAGFLVHVGYRRLDSEPAVALRISRKGDEYWARWGRIAQLEGWSNRLTPHPVQLDRCLTAAA